MHARLVSYLRDNRDQIIENWLTGTCVPAPVERYASGEKDGVVPYNFFTTAFEDVIERLEKGPPKHKADEAAQMNQFLGFTCECRQRCFGGRICIELHDSGLAAFMSVFRADWDRCHEFNDLDRECSENLINHALSGFFGREIETCVQKTFRTDCPFASNDKF